MPSVTSLPLFHLYGDPPDEQAFDFIHIETISSRSSVHDWTIRAHRHANLFQILVIERGGGEMALEATTTNFAAPAAILLPATVAHGFRFQREVTEGWVVSFTEDVTHGLGERSGEAMARLNALASEPIVPVTDAAEVKHLSALCADLRRTVSRARRLSVGDARLSRPDRDRGGTPRCKPRAHRRGDVTARGPYGCEIAAARRSTFPQPAPAGLLRRRSGDDPRPPQRSRQARDRRHRGSS